MREMKNSGVEWIGDIPANWEVKKFKHVADIYTGNSIKDEEKSMYEDPNEAVPYIATKDIKSVFNTVDYGNGIYIKNDDLSFVRAYSGDTLMCIEGGSAGKKKARIDRTVCFVNKLCCFHATAINSDFLYYILNSPNYEEEFMFNITGLIGGVSKNKLMNFVLPFPSLPEQHRIADFLDEKCAKIDAVIEKQKQVIEKLKEYKLSVITEAVTKGLDPTVPMKDSGIELCKTIPAFWKTKQIRYLFKLRDEKNYLNFNEVTLLSLYTDLGVFPHGEQEERGNKAVTVEGYKTVYKNDIVVNIILAWMGAIGVSNYNGVTSPAYDIYSPQQNVNSKYYHYMFRTKLFSGECYKYGRGIMAMRWRTYSSEFKSIKVPVPPIEVQDEIADYLDSKCIEIDKIMSTKQSIIEKLTEYKKSLIYEVVTGKKEV